jgi:hypothetical protein
MDEVPSHIRKYEQVAAQIRLISTVLPIQALLKSQCTYVISMHRIEKAVAV